MFQELQLEEWKGHKSPRCRKLWELRILFSVGGVSCIGCKPDCSFCQDYCRITSVAMSVKAFISMTV